MRFDVMPVATEKQIIEVEEAAFNVWHNYYKDIFSKEQIDYMLKKYQSREALKKQIADGYIYYMILADNHLAGYMCVLVQSNYLYLARLYIKAEYRRQGIAKKTIFYFTFAHSLRLFSYFCRHESPIIDHPAHFMLSGTPRVGTGCAADGSRRTHFRARGEVG